MARILTWHRERAAVGGAQERLFRCRRAHVLRRALLIDRSVRSSIVSPVLRRSDVTVAARSGRARSCGMSSDPGLGCVLAKRGIFARAGASRCQQRFTNAAASRVSARSLAPGRRSRPCLRFRAIASSARGTYFADGRSWRRVGLAS